MRTRYLMVALALPLTAGTVGGPERRDVLGGEMAGALLYPYLAHLEVPLHGTCSAALIAMDWIVTAAHCVVGANESDVKFAEVSVGWDSGTQYRRVSEVWVHPRYTRQDDATATDWDVALARLMRPVEDPAAPVKLGSSALSALVQPGEPVVIVGDAGVRGRPIHATIVLEDCPAEAGDSSRQACHGQEERPVISPGDSGGPLLVGDRAGGARLMGVASTGATIGGVGWTRWTRIEHVSEWILAVLLLQGTEGRSESPSCAMPPTRGDAAPVGGRIFSQERMDMCVPLGDTGEGVLFEYRASPGSPAAASIFGAKWHVSGASDYTYGTHVKDSSGKLWNIEVDFEASPCGLSDFEIFMCKLDFRQDEDETGVSLDLAKNPSIRCVPVDDQ